MSVPLPTKISSTIGTSTFRFLFFTILLLVGTSTLRPQAAGPAAVGTLTKALESAEKNEPPPASPPETQTSPQTEQAPATATPPSETPAPPPDDYDDEYATKTTEAYDPLEGFNRAMFTFNNAIYIYIGRPVSKAYQFVVPEIPRQGISNFFDNIRFPVRFVANVLQLRFNEAARETGKFVVNSTIGLAGFIRVSNKIPALSDEQLPSSDSGQTLGAWDIPRGPYLVLPLMGPVTTRDAIGRVGDYFLVPYNWRGIRNHQGIRWYWFSGASALETLNGIPALLKAYDLAVKSAIDPYIAMRDGYIQYREATLRPIPKYVLETPAKLIPPRPRSKRF